jgi:hypothetical protein
MEQETNLPYQPTLIDTRNIELASEIQPLIERLAEHNHDLWAKQRIAEGWRLGPQRNGQKKEHPCLIPYSDLPESEKEYERIAAIGTLTAIIALGYRIENAK